MSKVGIFFGTDMGSTRKMAKLIKNNLVTRLRINRKTLIASTPMNLPVMTI